MALQDFVDSADEPGAQEQKSTTLEFKNPKHPGTARKFEDDERYFEAARKAKHMMGSYRYQLVGEFLHAVMEMEDGNAEPMKHLIRGLSGSPVRDLTDAQEYPVRE